jgi:hypothetical protein
MMSLDIVEPLELIDSNPDIFDIAPDDLRAALRAAERVVAD